MEAFGYRNLEFEGWEADDAIATLAWRADQAGVKTCVVPSIDRDAFQLCSENTYLMMTLRGVADVHVYTPERVLARYGIPPERVPDFIGLKGDTSDAIEGVPGIGDKTAGQLITAQFGSLENAENIDDVSGEKRRETLRTHTEQAMRSKDLATMRRDLPLDCDPADLVLDLPDRSRLKEIFRRYEFRNLLPQRIDLLEEAIPSAPLKLEGGGAVAGGRARGHLRPRARCSRDGRYAARDDVVVGDQAVSVVPHVRSAALVAHDFKALPREFTRRVSRLPTTRC